MFLRVSARERAAEKGASAWVRHRVRSRKCSGVRDRALEAGVAGLADVWLRVAVALQMNSPTKAVCGAADVTANVRGSGRRECYTCALR